MNKFSQYQKSMTSKQEALARKFQEYQITSYSQAVKAFGTRDNAQIEAWKIQLTSKVNQQNATDESTDTHTSDEWVTFNADGSVTRSTFNPQPVVVKAAVPKAKRVTVHQQQIIDRVERDFGIIITPVQADEISMSLKDGVVIWKQNRYTTTRNTDDINSMDNRGVWYSAYQTFYSRKEWNAMVRSGEFS